MYGSLSKLFSHVESTHSIHKIIWVFSSSFLGTETFQKPHFLSLTPDPDLVELLPNVGAFTKTETASMPLLSSGWQRKRVVVLTTGNVLITCGSGVQIWNLRSSIYPRGKNTKGLDDDFNWQADMCYLVQSEPLGVSAKESGRCCFWTECFTGCLRLMFCYTADYQNPTPYPIQFFSRGPSKEVCSHSLSKLS